MSTEVRRETTHGSELHARFLAGKYITEIKHLSQAYFAKSSPPQARRAGASASRSRRTAPPQSIARQRRTSLRSLRRPNQLQLRLHLVRDWPASRLRPLDA